MTTLEMLLKVEQADQLIRLKATGKSDEFAQKLGMSSRNVFNLINFMKELGAPIYYCHQRMAYCYLYEVKFNFGFVLNDHHTSITRGGKKLFSPFFSTMQESCSPASVLCNIQR